MAIDLVRARRSNRGYARQLWMRRFPQLAHLLGFPTRSPGPDQFALAVADWQRRQVGLTVDGILGPQSWARLEPLTRFSAPSGRPPDWLAAPADAGDAADELVRLLGTPPTLTGPPRGAVTMVQGRRRHEPAVTQVEIALQAARQEYLRTVRALGRLHGTLGYIGRLGEPDMSTQHTPRGDLGPRLGERDREFLAARDAGLLARGASGGFVSTLPERPEFWQLEEYGRFLRVEFLDEFNEAVRDQWRVLQESELVDALALIASLLVDGLLFAVARPGVIARAAASTSHGTMTTVTLFGRGVAKARELLQRFVVAQRELVERILGSSPRGGVPPARGRPRDPVLDAIAGIPVHQQVERGVLIFVEVDEYLIRGEAHAAPGPGAYFNGPFRTLAEAEAEARRLARNMADFRAENAMPTQYVDEAAIGRVAEEGRAPGYWPATAYEVQQLPEVIRVYRVQRVSPAVQRVIAPQRERGTVMVRPGHLRALRTGNPLDGAEYPGGALEVILPSPDHATIVARTGIQVPIRHP